MNKFKQLIIALTCGFDQDHELVKEALDNSGALAGLVRETAVTPEELFSKTTTGKSIFEYKETWQHIAKLAELCPDLKGADFLKKREDGKSAIEHGKGFDLQNEAFHPPLWKDDMKGFEYAWEEYAKRSWDYDDYLEAKRKIAAAAGMEIREDRLKTMGIKRDDIEEAIKKGKYEDINKKFAADNDHLRAEDVLLLRNGNHLLQYKSNWEEADKLWKVLAENGEQMEPRHFLFKLGKKESPLEAAIKTAHMPEKIFNADLWAGRLDQMIELYDAAEDLLTESELKSIHIEKVVSEIVGREYSDTIVFDGNLEKADLLTSFHAPITTKNGQEFVTTPLSIEKTWEKMDEVRAVLRGKGQQLTLADLRQGSGLDHEPYMVQAARFGRFDQVIAILEENGERLSAEDLTKDHAGNKSVLDILSGHDQVGLVLKPELWAGREEELYKVWDEIPQSQKKDLDFGNLLGELTVIRLREHFSGRGAGVYTPNRSPDGPSPMP